MQVVEWSRGGRIAAVALVLLGRVTSLTGESAVEVKLESSLQIVDIILIICYGFDFERVSHNIILGIFDIFNDNTHGVWHDVSEYKGVYDSDGVVVTVYFTREIVLVHSN